MSPAWQNDDSTNNNAQQQNEALQHKLAQRSADLACAYQELQLLAYSVSHDLRAPLRSIEGFNEALLDEYGYNLGEQGRHYLQRIRHSCHYIGVLIDHLLALSRLARVEMRRQRVDLTALANEILANFRRQEPQRHVTLVVAEGLTAFADAKLMRIVLEHLLGNAWKFTSRQKQTRIEFARIREGDSDAFLVRDNGVGFDMACVDRLFGVFQRLHTAEEFEGIGIRLATVQRIVNRHGGKVWIEGQPDKGATVYFTIPA